MTPGPVLRRVLLIVAIVLLLALTWTGISGGISQLSSTRTAGQAAQTVLQLVYGLFALLSIATTFWGRQWNRPMLVGWTVSLALTAGLASVVWGGTSILIGFLSGGAAGLIAVGIAWLLRVGGARGSLPL
jgi:hypothetical protein